MVNRIYIEVVYASNSEKDEFKIKILLGHMW